jgi:hypothetical protein
MANHFVLRSWKQEIWIHYYHCSDIPAKQEIGTSRSGTEETHKSTSNLNCVHEHGNYSEFVQMQTLFTVQLGK